MNARRLVSLTLLTTLAFGCIDQGPNAPIPPFFAIQDAAHGGAAGFYFLPPLVKQPVYSGSFDPAVAPTVEICESPACTAVHASFTMSSGAGSETIRVDPVNQFYIVNWRTDRTGAVAGRTYRVRVLVNGAVRGFADVWLAGAGAAPGNPDIAVLKGTTLPIKFRIETSGASQLPGAPADPAVAAIALLQMDSRPGDYRTDDPDVPGLPVSFNTLLISIRPDATIDQLNTLLRGLGAQIVGGIPGVAQQAAGILVLRLPTRSHAELAPVLAALRLAAIVRHVSQDKLLGPKVVTQTTNASNLGWTWSALTGDATWGLKMIRAPQMWNLNDGVQSGASTAKTVIYDGGVFNHEDLSFVLDLSPGIILPAPTPSHGTHVAGIIGATFNSPLGIGGVNSPPKGIDGVNPFAAMINKASFSTSEQLTSIAQLSQRSDVRVVNFSLGYDWTLPVVGTPRDTRVDLAAQYVANTDGQLVADALTAISAAGYALPVIVAAAGNESNVLPDQPAVYASPWGNAALAQGMAPIIVVESDSLATVSSTGVFAVRSDFSNVGGHVSAPGSQILSTVHTGLGYNYLSGTSMAAPHVSGLVGYLYALAPDLPAPTLVSNAIRDLLMSTAIPISPGVARMIDAFAAAMDLDRQRGNDLVLRALLDVDDGTVDGNTRIASDDVTDVLTEDADGNGRKGDGLIDMADFRRWRDWLLDTELSLNLSLNGVDHPKRDLNGDGVVGFASEENVFPRGDFNGDGIIHRTQGATVLGVLAGRFVTDLEVLQERFSDSHYTKAELPLLIDSGDLTLDVRACRTEVGVVTLRAAILPVANPAQPIQPRALPGLDTIDVFTLPVSAQGYRVQIEALNGSGAVIRRQTSAAIPLGLGEDKFFPADCRASVVVGAQSQSVAVGQTLQFTATVTGLPSTAVTWSATGGSIDGAGLYRAAGTTGTFHITATSMADPSISGTVAVQIVAGTGPPLPRFTLTGPTANDPPRPLHFQVTVVNLAIDDVQWGASASSIDTPNETPLLITLQRAGPIVADQYTRIWTFDLDYPPEWQTNIPLFPGLPVHTIQVTVCALKNGQFFRDATGNLVCSSGTVRVW